MKIQQRRCNFWWENKLFGKVFRNVLFEHMSRKLNEHSMFCFVNTKWDTQLRRAKKFKNMHMPKLQLFATNITLEHKEVQKLIPDTFREMSVSTVSPQINKMILELQPFISQNASQLKMEYHAPCTVAVPTQLPQNAQMLHAWPFRSYHLQQKTVHALTQAALLYRQVEVALKYQSQTKALTVSKQTHTAILNKLPELIFHRGCKAMQEKDFVKLIKLVSQNKVSKRGPKVIFDLKLGI